MIISFLDTPQIIVVFGCFGSIPMGPGSGSVAEGPTYMECIP